MAYTKFLLFILFALVSIEISLACRDPNKRHRYCGSECPKSCDNLTASCQGFSCVEGCFCKHGYVLQSSDANSRCIREEDCHYSGNQHQDLDGSCTDPDKEWRECGSSCPPTCLHPSRRCDRRECIEGCFCKSGYVYETNSLTSRCVRTSECGRQSTGDHHGRGHGHHGRGRGHRRDRHDHDCMDPTKEYRHCGSACPESCDTPNPACIRRCSSGCFCPAGMILASDNPDATCVYPSECDEIDRENYGSQSIRCSHPEDRNELCLGHAEAVRRLQAAGLDLSSPGRCNNKDRRECTSLQGIHQKAISNLIQFARNTRCDDITVVNGTEIGGNTGRFGHSHGWRLDIDDSLCVSRHIRDELRQVRDHYCDDDDNAYHQYEGFWEILFAEDAGLC